MELQQADPKGLVRESYAIEGITLAECKSIFIDWVLSLTSSTPAPEALRVLLATWSEGREDHPMTLILTEALTAPQAPRRRGGRIGRQAGL